MECRVTLPGRSGWVTIIVSLAMVGCSAPPVARVVQRAPVAAAQPRAPASAPRPVPPAVAKAPTPAESHAVRSALDAAASAPAASTVESAAVAARFPDPPVEFHTPAFQPGRTSFTSNAELQAALAQLARAGTTDTAAVKLLTMGHSQTGVPLQAVLFTRADDTDPAAILRANRPTVLLIGQQHGDEPASCEALLAVAQELAHGSLAPLLDRINVVIVPRANPDGARDTRRETATGIDMNRDHLLLKTPEAQAIAQLARDFRPIVVVDDHEYLAAGPLLDKFGLMDGHDAMLHYAMTGNMPGFVAKASEEWFRRPLVERLKEQGLRTEWYHTTSANAADKTLSMGSVQPDTMRNVYGLRNAVSLLVETRGIGLGRAHFKRRVFTHVSAVTTVLQATAGRAADLMKLRAFVDNEVSAQACQGEALVEAAATPSEYALTLLDPQTGADKTITVSWDSALALRPVKVRARPCGYWLAADQTDAVTRLRGLGVIVQQLDELGDMRGETYRETARESRRTDGAATIADPGGVLRLQVQTVPTLIDTRAGTYYVPLDQPLANLVIAALEPDSPTSFAGRGIVASVDSEARVMSPPNVKMVPLP